LETCGRTVVQQPGATQQEDVAVAIVIVIGADRIEAAELLVEGRAAGGNVKAAVGTTAVKRQRAAGILGRRDDVKQTVAVKVIRDDAAAEIKRIYPQIGRNVNKSLSLLTSPARPFRVQCPSECSSAL